MALLKVMGEFGACKEESLSSHKECRHENAVDGPTGGENEARRKESLRKWVWETEERSLGQNEHPLPLLLPNMFSLDVAERRRRRKKKTTLA